MSNMENQTYPADLGGDQWDGDETLAVEPELK